MGENNNIRKIIASVLIVAFVHQDIVWAQGGMPVWSRPASEKLGQPPSGTVPNFSIPKDIAVTKEVYSAPARTNEPANQRTIINIQDAHSSIGAQEAITSILDSLVTNYDLNMVAIEGSSGYIDTSFLKTFPDETIRKKTAQYLVNKGRMSAGEFFSITSNKNIGLYGIEDKPLYQQNVEEFRRLYEIGSSTKADIKALADTLKTLQDKLYSDDLKALDSNQILHQDGRITFTQRWSLVNRLGRKLGIDYKDYPNLYKLVESLKIEKNIDFDEANKERDFLIDALSKKLDKERLEELVLKSLSFKQSKISKTDFYLFLQGIAKESNIPPEPYRNLINYTDYIALYESIDLLDIFTEAKAYEDSIKEKLFTSDDQRNLYKISKLISLVKDLFEASLTNANFEDLAEQIKTCDTDYIREFLNNNLRNLRGGTYAVGQGYDLDKIFDNIPEALEFYKTAEKRNSVILKNTIKRMNEKNESVAALITGGYHSKGLTDLIKNAQASYLVILPKFDASKGERPYITILTNKKAPYENLLKSGQYYLATSAYFEGIGRGEDLTELAVRLEDAFKYSLLLSVTGEEDEDKAFIQFKKKRKVNPKSLEHNIGSVIEIWSSNYRNYYKEYMAQVKEAGIGHEPMTPETFEKLLNDLSSKYLGKDISKPKRLESTGAILTDLEKKIQEKPIPTVEVKVLPEKPVKPQFKTERVRQSAAGAPTPPTATAVTGVAATLLAGAAKNVVNNVAASGVTDNTDWYIAVAIKIIVVLVVGGALAVALLKFGEIWKEHKAKKIKRNEMIVRLKNGTAAAKPKEAPADVQKWMKDQLGNRRKLFSPKPTPAAPAASVIETPKPAPQKAELPKTEASNEIKAPEKDKAEAQPTISLKELVKKQRKAVKAKILVLKGEIEKEIDLIRQARDDMQPSGDEAGYAKYYNTHRQNVEGKPGKPGLIGPMLQQLKALKGPNGETSKEVEAYLETVKGRLAKLDPKIVFKPQAAPPIQQPSEGGRQSSAGGPRRSASGAEWSRKKPTVPTEAPSIELGMRALDRIVNLKLTKKRPVIVSLLGGGGMGTSTMADIIARSGLQGLRSEDIGIIDTDKYIPRIARYGSRESGTPPLLTHNSIDTFLIPENGLMEDYLNFDKFSQDMTDVGSRAPKVIVFVGVFSEFLLREHSGAMDTINDPVDVRVMYRATPEVRMRRVSMRDKHLERFHSANRALSRLTKRWPIVPAIIVNTNSPEDIEAIITKRRISGRRSSSGAENDKMTTEEMTRRILTLLEFGIEDNNPFSDIAQLSYKRIIALDDEARRGNVTLSPVVYHAVCCAKLFVNFDYRPIMEFLEMIAALPPEDDMRIAMFKTEDDRFASNLACYILADMMRPGSIERVANLSPSRSYILHQRSRLIGGPDGFRSMTPAQTEEAWKDYVFVFRTVLRMTDDILRHLVATGKANRSAAHYRLALTVLDNARNLLPNEEMQLPEHLREGYDDSHYIAVRDEMQKEIDRLEGSGPSSDTRSSTSGTAPSNRRRLEPSSTGPAIEIVNKAITPNVKILILDWDGTVVDSEAAWHSVWNDTYFHFLKGRWPNPEERTEYPELVEFFKDSFTTQPEQNIEGLIAIARSKGFAHVDDIDFNAFANDVQEHAAKIVPKETRAKDAAKAAITQAGIPIYIVSAGYSKIIKETADNLGLRDFISLDHIYGLGDNQQAASTKEELICLILEKEGMSDSEVAMIGNGVPDVKGGRDNGIVTVGLAADKDTREKMKAAGADILAHTLCGELLDCLNPQRKGDNAVGRRSSSGAAAKIDKDEFLRTCDRLSSGTFKLDNWLKPSEDEFVRLCDTVLSGRAGEAISADIIETLVKTFVSRWRNIWQPVGINARNALTITEGLGDAWLNNLPPLYSETWSRIAVWVREHPSNVTEKAWDNIAAKAFIELLEDHIRVSQEKAAFFDLFINDANIEEIWSIPTKFCEIHAAGHGNDFWTKKGSNITESALRGTIIGELTSDSEKDYIRIDQPLGKEAYLKRKLNKTRLAGEDMDLYETLIIDDIVRTFSILERVGKASLNKRVVFTDELKGIFARNNITLPHAATIGDVLGKPGTGVSISKPQSIIPNGEKAAGNVVVRDVIVNENPKLGMGLHANMAIKIAIVAAYFKETTISIINPKNGMRASAGSMLELLMLCIDQGEDAIIEAYGPDAERVAGIVGNILRRGEEARGNGAGPSFSRSSSSGEEPVKETPGEQIKPDALSASSRIIRLSIVAVVSLAAFFLLGDSYVWIVKSSFWSGLAAKTIVGGIALGGGSYVEQVLTSKTVDWHRIRLWTIAGASLLGFAAYGIWFPILMSVFSNEFWMMATDLGSFAPILMKMEYLFQKKFLLHEKLTWSDLKPTRKGFGLYLLNFAVFALPLWWGFTYKPDKVALIDATMAVVWSGVYVILLEYWGRLAGHKKESVNTSITAPKDDDSPRQSASSAYVALKTIKRAIKLQRNGYASAVRLPNRNGTPGDLLNLLNQRLQPNRLIIAGDLHGRLDNLHLLLSKADIRAGLDSGKLQIIFLGDAFIYHKDYFAGKNPEEISIFKKNIGKMQVDLIIELARLKCKYPGQIHILNGNHEIYAAYHLNERFKEFLKDKEGYSKESYKIFFESILKEYGEKHGNDIVSTVQDFFVASPYFARIQIGGRTYLLGHAAAINGIENWDDYVSFRLEHSDWAGFETSLYNAIGKGLPPEEEELAKELALKGFIDMQPLGISCFITGHMHFYGMDEGKRSRYGLVPIEGASNVIAIAHNSLIVIDSFFDTCGYLDISLNTSANNNAIPPLMSLCSSDGTPAFKTIAGTFSPYASETGTRTSSSGAASDMTGKKIGIAEATRICNALNKFNIICGFSVISHKDLLDVNDPEGRLYRKGLGGFRSIFNQSTERMPFMFENQFRNDELIDGFLTENLFQADSVSFHLKTVELKDGNVIEINLANPDTAALINDEHSALYDIVRITKPAYVSLHLSAAAEQRSYGTNERPYEVALSPVLSREEILKRFVDNINTLQTNLKKVGYDEPVLIESLDYHNTGAYEYITDPEFINEVLVKTGAHLLVDCAHIYIAAKNRNLDKPGYDFMEYVRQIVNENTIGLVDEVHLAMPEYSAQDGRYQDKHLPFLTDSSESRDVKSILSYILELRRDKGIATPLVVNFESDMEESVADVTALAKFLETQTAIATTAGHQSATGLSSEKVQWIDEILSLARENNLVLADRESDVEPAGSSTFYDSVYYGDLAQRPDIDRIVETSGVMPNEIEDFLNSWGSFNASYHIMSFYDQVEDDAVWGNLTDPFIESLIADPTSPIYENIRRMQPKYISLHLGYSVSKCDKVYIAGKRFFVPAKDARQFSREELLERMVNNINILMANLREMGCESTVLVETMQYARGGAYEYMCEPSFIKEVLRRTGAGLLLDCGHAVINSRNLPGYANRDYMEYMRDLINDETIASVKEMHIAVPCFSPEANMWMDFHHPFTYRSQDQGRDYVEGFVRHIVDLRRKNGIQEPLLTVFETDRNSYDTNVENLARILKEEQARTSSSGAGIKNRIAIVIPRSLAYGYGDALIEGFRELDSKRVEVELLTPVKGQDISKFAAKVRSKHYDMVIANLHGAHQEEPVAFEDFGCKTVILVHRPWEAVERNQRALYGDNKWDAAFKKASATILLGDARIPDYRRYCANVMSIPHGFRAVPESIMDDKHFEAGVAIGSRTVWSEMRKMADLIELVKEVKRYPAGQKVFGYIAGYFVPYKDPDTQEIVNEVESLKNSTDVVFLQAKEIDDACGKTDGFNDFVSLKRWLYAKSENGSKVIIVDGELQKKKTSQLEALLIDFSAEMYHEIMDGFRPKDEYSGAMHRNPGSKIAVGFRSGSMEDMEIEGLAAIQADCRADGSVDFKSAAKKIIGYIEAPDRYNAARRKTWEMSKELTMRHIAARYEALAKSISGRRSTSGTLPEPIIATTVIGIPSNPDLSAKVREIIVPHYPNVIVYNMPNESPDTLSRFAANQGISQGLVLNIPNNAEALKEVRRYLKKLSDDKFTKEHPEIVILNKGNLPGSRNSLRRIVSTIKSNLSKIEPMTIEELEERTAIILDTTRHQDSDNLKGLYKDLKELNCKAVSTTTQGMLESEPIFALRDKIRSRWNSMGITSKENDPVKEVVAITDPNMTDEYARKYIDVLGLTPYVTIEFARTEKEKADLYARLNGMKIEYKHVGIRSRPDEDIDYENLNGLTVLELGQKDRKGYIDTNSYEVLFELFVNPDGKGIPGISKDEQRRVFIYIPKAVPYNYEEEIRGHQEAIKAILRAA